MRLGSLVASMQGVNYSIWAGSMVLAGLLGCGRSLISVDDEAGSSHDEIGGDEGEAGGNSESTLDGSSEGSSEPESSTDTTDATDTTGSETSTDTTDTTDIGEPLCADACGTPNCGSCPDSPMIEAEGYRIDATETTVAAYAMFLSVELDPSVLSPTCGWKPGVGFEPDDWATQLQGDPDVPVIGIDWCDADSYCRWQGRRLCGLVGGEPASFDQLTDDSNEWYVACSEGATRLYPYGNAYQELACNGVDLGVDGLVPVASLPACQGSHAGLFDMSGNAWEWTNSCDEDPDLGHAEQLCLRRGGSFKSDNFVMRCAVDSQRARGYRTDNTGIRCCATP